jgi:hypothetical protein
MRLFIFKSGVNDTLRAFAGDLLGGSLPQQFKPWTAIGAIAAGADMPYRLDRAAVESAITQHGFQLWRYKPVSRPDDAGALAADRKARS